MCAWEAERLTLEAATWQCEAETAEATASAALSVLKRSGAPFGADCKRATSHTAEQAAAAEQLLRDAAGARGVEFNPVCAIVGGLVGQEVVKAASGKGEPVCNTLVFDARDTGAIEVDLRAAEA